MPDISELKKQVGEFLEKLEKAKPVPTKPSDEAIIGPPILESKQTSDEAIIEFVKQLPVSSLPGYPDVVEEIVLKKFPLLHPSAHLTELIKAAYEAPEFKPSEQQIIDYIYSLPYAEEAEVLKLVMGEFPLIKGATLPYATLVSKHRKYICQLCGGTFQGFEKANVHVLECQISKALPALPKPKEDFLAELTKLVTLMDEAWEGPVPTAIILKKKENGWVIDELTPQQELTLSIDDTFDLSKQTIQIELGPHAVEMIMNLAKAFSEKAKSKSKKSKMGIKKK